MNSSGDAIIHLPVPIVSVSTIPPRSGVTEQRQQMGVSIIQASEAFQSWMDDQHAEIQAIQIATNEYWRCHIS